MSNGVNQGQPTRGAIREMHHNAMERKVSAAKIGQHSAPYEELSALHNQQEGASERDIPKAQGNVGDHTPIGREKISYC